MRIAAALGLLLAGCAPPAAGGGGIVSTNPCADAILVHLVAPTRIAAISRYSHDAAATSLPLPVARRFRATAGTAEEVIALRPALVLASSFTPAATRDAYARAGLRTLYLDSPTTVAASIAQVREVAAVVGAEEKGETLIRSIESALLPLRRRPGSSSDAAGNGGQSSASERLATGPRRSPGWESEGRQVAAAVGAEGWGERLLPPRWRPGSISDAAGSGGQSSTSERLATGPRPSPGWERKERPAALLYIAGDLANGSGTLLGELTRRAGFRNAAADYGLRHTGTLPAEHLVARPPDVIIATGEGRTAALRRALLPATPQARFNRNLVNCGGPTIPAALARLRAIRASL